MISGLPLTVKWENIVLLQRSQASWATRFAYEPLDLFFGVVRGEAGPDEPTAVPDAELFGKRRGSGWTHDLRLGSGLGQDNILHTLP